MPRTTLVADHEKDAYLVALELLVDLRDSLAPCGLSPAARAAFDGACRDLLGSVKPHWRDGRPWLGAASHYLRTCGSPVVWSTRTWAESGVVEAVAWTRARSRRGGVDDQTNRLLLRKIYWACPPGRAVDHIIPIGSGGAHTPENLQYVKGRGDLVPKPDYSGPGRDPRHLPIRAIDHRAVAIGFEELLVHPLGAKSRGPLAKLWLRYFDGFDARLRVEDAEGRRIHATRIEAAAAREGGAFALTPDAAARHPTLWATPKAFEGDVANFPGALGVARRMGAKSGSETRIFVEPEARGRARELIEAQIGPVDSIDLPDLLDSLTVD